MVVTLTGCSIITITDFTLYFFDQDYKVVRMSFFDRCSQILHNFFLCAENELINNFPSFCFLQVDEKTICPHQCKWNTYYYQGRHLPSNIGGAWDIFKEKGERRKEEWGKREKKNWGKEEKGKRVKRETLGKAKWFGRAWAPRAPTHMVPLRMVCIREPLWDRIAK